jgi:hypothetical protein
MIIALRNTGAIVIGLRVTDLAETGTGTVDESVHRVSNRQVYSTDSIDTLKGSSQHEYVSGAVRVMTGFAERILRTTLSGKMGTHVLEPGNCLGYTGIVAGGALSVVVRLIRGQADGIAEDAGNMSSRGIMARDTYRGASHRTAQRVGRRGVTRGLAHGLVWSSN